MERMGEGEGEYAMLAVYRQGSPMEWTAGPCAPLLAPMRHCASARAAQPAQLTPCQQ